jgi:multicomponent Na+:H+ antiporter subunit C
MSSYILYAMAGVIIFCIGLYGAVSRRHLMQKIIGLNIMSGGVFLLLISIGKRNMVNWPDPVPHAMVLTGIVVALAASAFTLALARRIYEKTGKMELPQQDGET